MSNFLKKWFYPNPKQILNIEGKDYEIIEKTIYSEYRTVYKLKHKNEIYIFRCEDYSKAEFMIDKFKYATIFNLKDKKIRRIKSYE